MAKPCFYIDGKYMTKDEAIEWASKVEFSRIGKILPQYSHPETPFRKTDQWVNLSLRRMMRYAAENGFDRIAWTNGEMQAERYDLSKQVKQVKYYPEENRLVVHGTQRDNIVNELNVTPDKIEGYIGKEASKKLLSSNVQPTPKCPKPERLNKENDANPAPDKITTTLNALVESLRRNRAYKILPIYSKKSDQLGPLSGNISPLPRTSGPLPGIAGIRNILMSMASITIDRAT